MELRFMYDGFALSVRGYKHIVENIARQDSAMFHVDPEGWAMAAVADGHGGDEYFRSHVGSRLAVESALRSVRDCFQEKEAFREALYRNADEILHRLESNIINNWNTLIRRFNEDPQTFDWNSPSDTLYETTEEDAEAPIQDGISPGWEEKWMAEHDVEINEDCPERMYGSTLLVAVMTAEFCFSLQIGDGCCVLAYPDGHARIMIPLDESKPRNLTNSLCENNALKNFRHDYVLYQKEQSRSEAEPANALDREDGTVTQTAQISEMEITEAAEEGSVPEMSDISAVNTSDISESIYEGEPALETEAAKERAHAAVPAGIILSTDGLFNSFARETYPETFLRFNCRVLGNMEPSVRNDFSNKLETHLNERSEKGSKDDISIALIFDRNMDYEAVKPG